MIILLQCATCESHLSNSTPIVQKWAYTPEADKFVVSRRPEPEQQEFHKLRWEIINYLVGMHLFISYTRRARNLISFQMRELRWYQYKKIASIALS